MGNVCDKIGTPDPKLLLTTDKITGEQNVSTNPCGRFSREDNDGNNSGYTLQPVNISLTQFPPNYCIRYGPVTWLGPVTMLAIFVALIVLNTFIPEAAPAADEGLMAAATAVETGVDVGTEGTELADIAGIPEEAADDAADDAEDDDIVRRRPVGQQQDTPGHQLVKDLFEWGAKYGKTAARTTVYWAAPAVVGGVTIASVASVAKQLNELQGTADQIEKFCTSIGDLDENGNSQWISSFSASKAEKDYQEWMLDVKASENDCTAGDLGNNYQSFPKFGVCKNRCPNPGKRPTCVRNKVNNNYVFSGNKVACCFADYRINGESQLDANPGACYEDPATKQRTCHPWYRDLSSTTCLAQITPYCLGEAMVPDQKDWMEMWLMDSAINFSSFMEVNTDPIPNSWNNVNSDSKLVYDTVAEKANAPGNTNKVTSPCLTAVARAMYVNTDQVANWQDLKNFKLLKGAVNKVGYPWAQDTLNIVFQKYLKEYGSFIGGVDQDGYERSSKFQDLMWEICNNFPQLCQQSLKGFCANVRAEDLPYIVNGQQWCGCFLPEKEYERYDRLNIPRECNPLCNADGVIPLTDNNYVSKICTNNLCVIDDLTLEIISSQTENFNFNQVCRSCGSVNINETMDDLLYKSLNETGANSSGDNPLAIQTPSGFQTGDIFIPFIDDSTGTTVYPQNPTQLNDFKLNGFNLFTTEIKNLSDIYISDTFYLLAFNTSDESNITNIALITFNIQKSIYIDNKGNKNNAWGIVSFNPNMDKPGVGYYDNMAVLPSKTTQRPTGTTQGFDVACMIINFKSTQRTVTRANIDDVIISANTCSCIIDDSTLSAVNSKVRGLNLTQNCGSASCTDNNGKPIACTSVSGGFNNISSVKDSLSSFQSDQQGYKFSTLIIAVFLIFLIFLIAFYAIFS